MSRLRRIIAATIAALIAVVVPITLEAPIAHASTYLGYRPSEWNTTANFYCYAGNTVTNGVRRCNALPSGGPRAFSRFPYPGQSQACYGRDWWDPKSYTSNNYVFSPGTSASGLYFVC